MNKEKVISYKVRWSQPYTEWVEVKVEETVDMTDFKEANELIERIKKL